MNRLHRLVNCITNNQNRNVSTTITRKKCFIVKDHDDFVENVMNSNVPVIVNFHADWCAPCHMLTPKLQSLVEHSEEISLAIVDVEKHADLVHTFEVAAVPAVLAIKNGHVIDKFIGLVDSSIIENLIVNLGTAKKINTDKNDSSTDSKDNIT